MLKRLRELDYEVGSGIMVGIPGQTWDTLANVVMPNLTPPGYRALYDIYPEKACTRETAEHRADSLEADIRRLGREVGRGPGPRRGRSGSPLSPAGESLHLGLPSSRGASRSP
jgi:hypothetical protein